MMGGRKRSVGFEASAWIPAARIIASRLQRPFKIGRTKGIAIYGKDKGTAVPAREGTNVYAIIENNAKQSVKIGAASLQDAINTESEEIRKHTIDVDMKDVFDQFNEEARR
jgi:hypothetical protein